MVSERENTKTFKIITFRVNNEDIIAFKKYQFLLNTNQNEYFSNQKTLVSLILNAKKFFETSGHSFIEQPPENFLKEITNITKKNLKLSNPRLLLINITESEKQLFYQIAYAIYTHDKIKDISYPYIFKRLLEISENIK